MGIQHYLRAQRGHNEILRFKFRHTAGKQPHPVVIHQGQPFPRPSGVGAQPSTLENLNIAPAQSLNQNDALEVLKAADRLQFGQGCLIGPSRPQPEYSTRSRGVDPQSIGAGLGSTSALALHPSCAIDRLSAKERATQKSRHVQRRDLSLTPAQRSSEAFCQ